MLIDALISQWSDVRSGLIEEVSLIPADRFSFQPSPECRTVTQLIQHIVETQKTLTGEVCKPNTNFGQGFPQLIAEHAPGVSSITDKDGLIKLLSDSMEQGEATIRNFGEDGLQTTMMGFSGKEGTKYYMLNFSMSHEMYHRGQITVYQRMLGIEPALTTRLKKMFASRG